MRPTGNTSPTRPEVGWFLDQAVSRLRWVILATTLLVTLAWPIASRTGHPLWLFILIFAGYNLLVELLRRRLSRWRVHSWRPILDLLVAASLYYFDAEPVGPLFVLFYLPVVCAAVSMTLRGSLLYTAAVVVTVALIAPTLPLWASTGVYFRQFATRLLVLALVGVGTAFLTQRLAREQQTARTLRDEAERLEELDRLRADLISTVSHDLRTPLTAARAGLGLLETSIADRLQGDERQLLANARRNIERLSLLIDDLLAFNQLEAGVLRLDREVLDLRAVVSDAIAAVHPLLNEKGQPLEVDLPEPLPHEGDARRLEQVLVNLLANAHRHTPPGTRIAIAGRLQEREILLSVSDDGPGIPAGELEAIFRRFYRPASVESHASGTGLGLAIARSLVELHGGRIWAESVPGQGAAFHIVLPRYRTSESHGAQAAHR